MKTLSVLVKRNAKIYFQDKGLFFTSLITPLILLVLYGTFLRKVYEIASGRSSPPPVSRSPTKFSPDAWVATVLLYAGGKLRHRGLLLQPGDGPG